MKSNILPFLLYLGAALGAAAQPAGQQTWCNPVDIAYRYNFEQMNEGISYHSGANPVLINHRGDTTCS